MWDETRNGKKYQDDYTLIKRTIKEIVGKSKSKTPEKAAKIKKKKQEPTNRSEDLMKQFFELQKFQKGLASAALDGNNKTSSKLSKSKEYTESSEDSEYRNTSYNTRDILKNQAKGRPKIEEYNTDELSDLSCSEESERAKSYEEAGSDSDESSSESTSSRKDNVQEVSSGLIESDKKQILEPPVQPVKKKCSLSASELAIIKDLCRDLIKKEEEPKEDRSQKPEFTIQETIIEEYPEVNSGKEMCFKTVQEEEAFIIKPENIQHIEINTKKQDYNIDNTKTQPENNPVNANCEPLIYESATSEETPESVSEQNKINEIKQEEKEPNEDLTNALIAQGELTLFDEIKEVEAITNDEVFEKVHLEIVTKETVEEVDEWKQRIEEKVVIEKTVVVKTEEAEVIQEVEKETQEVILSNMSDDDLIRKTMCEMDQINQEFPLERAYPEQDNDGYYYYYEDMAVSETKKTSLEQRIDFLQDQILSLRAQLEDAKRKNVEEAMEVDYLSALLSQRQAYQLPNDVTDWDEWELKEMIRERMQQKRLAAAQDYQARLGVVEALCSAEMGKLEEALQTLLPLNATVSTWDSPQEVHQDISTRSSWQTQDYVFEVVTSMNLSSSDDNGVSGTISTNGEQPSFTEQ